MPWICPIVRWKFELNTAIGLDVKKVFTILCNNNKSTFFKV